MFARGPPCFYVEVFRFRPGPPADSHRLQEDPVATCCPRTDPEHPPTVRSPTARSSPVRCGICGLRMWGNRRRNTTYYSRQPSHQRSKDIPAGHPPHVYLNEERINGALLPFLAGMLGTAPQSELRALFDALQLDVDYQPSESALDVAATLYDRNDDNANCTQQLRAEDWLAPPAGIGPATPGLGNQCSIH